MKESLLHHIWSNGHLSSFALKTTSGKEIKVLYPGSLNSHAGPDFLNAELIIGNVYWVGNVEIHVNTSNYLEHNHNTDEAYNNLILHVVYHNNTKLDQVFPTLELKNYMSVKEIEDFEQKFENQEGRLQEKTEMLEYSKVSQINFEKFAIQRLNRKSVEIEHYLKETKNDWQEVFYRLLSKNFGFQVNAFPFEWLSRSTPLSIIRPHQAKVQMIEALLFGQSGLLQNADKNNAYVNLLCFQYERFKFKYGLKSIKPSAWKFMRMRPMNFPTIRISQLAAIINRNDFLAYDALEIKQPSDANQIFGVEASEFWKDHYSFKQRSKYCVKRIGIQTMNNTLINTVIPFQYVYNRKHGISNYVDISLSFLSIISPEENSYIRKWKKMGLRAESALKTQALVELKSHYNI